MKVKIREDLASGCEIHIHCQSREQKEVKDLLFLLETAQKRIPASREGQTCLLSPAEILYGEAVDGNVFLYTRAEVYSYRYSLHFLSREYARAGFFRCGKSSLLNLRRARQLWPQPGGRLLVTLENDEQLLVSRRYAVLLRRRLEAGSEQEETR